LDLPKQHDRARSEESVAVFEWPEGIEFVDSSQSGLARRRHGRGFVYLTPEGRRVTDRFTIARIAAIAIPPAWTGVWIAPSVHAHLQATGRDRRHRKQYRYNPVWTLRRQRANYERLLDFSRALPALRAFVDAGLKRPCLDRERVLALAVRLLDSGMIRIGNDEYERANGSRGLTTLRKNNVAIRGSEVRFHFVGKGSTEYDLALNDPRAARALRRCHELPGHRLFRYVDKSGDAHPIASGDINSLLEELTGQKFTAKDFRTWAGTVSAFAELAGREPGRSETATVRIVKEAMRKTARRLGNTVAVCRRHYVHPRVVEAFAAGKLARVRIGRRGAGGLTPSEAALARFLENG
jgi:DNA topoisomerase-1